MLTLGGNRLWLCLGFALISLCSAYPARFGAGDLKSQSSDSGQPKPGLKGGRRLFWAVEAPDDYKGSPLDKNDGVLSFLITIWSKRAQAGLPPRLSESPNLKSDLRLLEDLQLREALGDENETTGNERLNEIEARQEEDGDGAEKIKRGLGKLSRLVSFGARSPLNYQLSKFRSSNRGYGVSSRSGAAPMIRNGRKIMKSMGLLSNVMSHLRNFAPPNNQPRYIG